jgi:hypothetical protein
VTCRSIHSESLQLLKVIRACVCLCFCVMLGEPGSGVGEVQLGVRQGGCTEEDGL